MRNADRFESETVYRERNRAIIKATDVTTGKVFYFSVLEDKNGKLFISKSKGLEFSSFSPSDCAREAVKTWETEELAIKALKFELWGAQE